MLGDETPCGQIARELVATILDRSRECSYTDACACEEDIASTGQAGESYLDCLDAGGSAVAGMGDDGLMVIYSILDTLPVCIIIL